MDNLEKNTNTGNSGSGNSGDCNIGDFNIGDWNSASFSFGCFNTPDMQEPKISLFNKPSDWTWEDWLHSEAREVMDYLKVYPVRRVDQEIMTEDEKKEHPEYAVTQGYLQTLSEEEQILQRIKKWRELSDEKSVSSFQSRILTKKSSSKIQGLMQTANPNGAVYEGRRR